MLSVLNQDVITNIDLTLRYGEVYIFGSDTSSAIEEVSPRHGLLIGHDPG